MLFGLFYNTPLVNARSINYPSSEYVISWSLVAFHQDHPMKPSPRFPAKRMSCRQKATPADICWNPRQVGLVIVSPKMQYFRPLLCTGKVTVQRSVFDVADSRLLEEWTVQSFLWARTLWFRSRTGTKVWGRLYILALAPAEFSCHGDFQPEEYSIREYQDLKQANPKAEIKHSRSELG